MQGGEMPKVTNVTVSATGIGWFTFWMFTIALAKLSLGSSIAAIFVWPYYPGEALAR